MGQPSRTKVLFAIPELDRGGPDRVFYEIVTKLDRRRFAPAVMVSVEDGHYLSLLRRELEVHVVGGRRPITTRYPVWPAWRLIQKLRPDVVFATQRMILTLGLTAPAFPAMTRMIVRQANDLTADFASLFGRSLLKHRVAHRLVLRTIRRADAVVCQSRAMRDDVARLLGEERENLHVISNPIDVQRVAGLVKPGGAALRGRPALVAVGRLTRQKGFDVLLNALATVRPRHPDLHLSIIGDGPERSSLEALASSLGLASAVTFMGFCEEPLPLVHAADLFVLASRYEGFPNAALEALACGTPVVLTDSPGANSEIVRAAINGRLSRTNDADGFAQALELAIRDLPSYDRAGIRKDCEERYSSTRIIAQYERVIANVAARGERGEL